MLEGGNEEKPLDTAKRETEEEASIVSEKFLELTSMCHVAANQFSEKAQAAWGEKTIVIPVYTFAVLCDAATQVCISDEHLEYKWCQYSEARELLHFDLDKTALYELNERIIRNVI